MKLKKTKLAGYVGLMVLVVQILFIPSAVKAADSSHYQLKMWKMGVVGNTASINFGYIGSDGASLVATLPIEPSLVAGHENDPSWTQYDSAAPLLAYIQKYGIENNIKEAMNPTCYDPSIFKALSAQGVNLSQLGGPNVPPGSTPPSNLVGKATYNNNVDKVLVGVGVPAPDLSGFLGTVSKPTTAPVAKETATTPTPPPPPAVPVSTPPVTTQTEAKVGTELNPVPESQEPASESKADPERTDPPIMALEDKSETKIEPPAAVDIEPEKTPWLAYAEIAGAGILALGLLLFVKFKYLKA